MNVIFETAENATIASISGRLDGATSPQVERELVARLGDRRLILDMSSLKYISSAGLRVVLVVAKSLKQSGGAFVIAGIPPHIRDVFEISGFLRIILTAENRNEALAAIQSIPAESA